jgi:very-short-patch-repair endonuclease
LIVVGDPKQLPPTNFFSPGEDADDETILEQEDLESILDELLTQGLRHKRLQWHYRSRHEGLIAFSNRHYYENDLLTFPSPQTGLGGVRFVHLPDARYDKGDTRTNPKEARALATELTKRLRAPGEHRSFGVVTFSQAQQELIENLIDEERRKHPEIETHFGDTPPVEGEPVFVKSLESVQGDERDVILFSIGYGLDQSGHVSMNFGPLNREGGERRLNVAITRAKHEVIVCSGLRGEQIDLTRSRARGVRDLKHFLEYAERGPKALVAPKNSSGTKAPDSGFEQLVENALRPHGYEVHRQVGCSGYRIDLAVLHPDQPERYLLGIECDGPTYGRAATARDRDKLRQAILQGLGWNIQRIWSTDWWHDSEQQTKKLIATLERLKGSKSSVETEAEK